MSVLDGRDALRIIINQVAEVAGYLWEKGWAERNGGNITVNVTELVDAGMRALPALSEPQAIGAVLPHLQGCWFYCKGTQKRMRDLARDPMGNGSLIRITEDCAHYEIVADLPVLPNLNLPRMNMEGFVTGETAEGEASGVSLLELLMAEPAAEGSLTEGLPLEDPPAGAAAVTEKNSPDHGPAAENPDEKTNEEEFHP